MNEIVVTNNNDFYWEDRYDGRQFGFPPKEKVLVPEVAAAHMLGFGRADKTETLTRMGWANLENDLGVKQLAKFVFTRAMMIERPAEPSPEALELATSEGAAQAAAVIEVE